MKTKALFSGIMVGTVLSAVATLLTTPASGREVQATCKDRVCKIRSGFQQLSNDSKALTEQIKTTTQISKETLKNVGTEVKDSIDHWKRDVEPTLKQLKEDVDTLQRNIEQAKQTSS